ncbi:MAG TPA: hypothetical protein VMF89_23685, partial [Polyangiales bacterium]|nr:hypothetical protein [Polyangiales bacterium]
MSDMSKLLVRVLSCVSLVGVVSCSSDSEDPPDAGDAAVQQESNAAREENAGVDEVTQAGRSARATRLDAGMDSGEAAPTPRDTKPRANAQPKPEKPTEPEPEPELDEDAGAEPLPECLPFELPADCPEVTGLSSPLSLHCAGLYAD